MSTGVAEQLGTGMPALPTADDVEMLLAEYESLFVGPGPVPCPPYESYWRDDVPVYLRRSLMGPCTEDLRRLYQQLGLRVATAAGEMPDHVALELEALAYALKMPDAELVAHALVVDHLTAWLPKLCHAVADQATHLFYTELAASTISWLPTIENIVVGLGPDRPE
jgi:TorA maturation chaperone TorD